MTTDAADRTARWPSGCGRSAAADRSRTPKPSGSSRSSSWSVLVEPGDGVAGRLVAALGPRGGASTPPARARSMRRGGARAGVTPGGARRGRGAVDAAAGGIRRSARPIDLAARARVRLIVPGDAEWPAAVDDLGDHAPLCLWVRGDVARARRRAGRPSRSSGRGRRPATASTSRWSSARSSPAAGVTVVSGAAYGIDGMAHRAALAAGGPTLALLAGGVDRAYPAGHANLLERIASAGAVVSEVPCGGAPTKWRFLTRNRLIAALGPGDRRRGGRMAERVAQHGGARGHPRTAARRGARAPSPRPHRPAAIACCASSTRDA